MKAKKHSRRITMYVLLIILAGVLFGSFGQIAFKSGMSGLGKTDGLLSALSFSRIYQILSNKIVIFGILLYAISTLLYLAALSNTNLSYAYPLVGLSFVIVPLLAIYFFGESIPLVRWLGIILITIGVYFVARS